MNREELRAELKPLRDDLNSLLRALTAPDDGWYARVNKNTSWRKLTQKVGWLTLGALIITAIDRFI